MVETSSKSRVSPASGPPVSPSGSFQGLDQGLVMYASMAPAEYAPSDRHWCARHDRHHRRGHYDQIVTTEIAISIRLAPDCRRSLFIINERNPFRLYRRSAAATHIGDWRQPACRRGIKRSPPAPRTPPAAPTTPAGAASFRRRHPDASPPGEVPGVCGSPATATRNRWGR